MLIVGYDSCLYPYEGNHHKLPHINPKFICLKDIDLIHVGITCQGSHPCLGEWLNGRG